MLSKRVQILVGEKEYKKLKDISKKSRKSLGQIFREAIQLYGERLASRVQRLTAVEKMIKLKIPALDWPKMERSILQASHK